MGIIKRLKTRFLRRSSDSDSSVYNHKPVPPKGDSSLESVEEGVTDPLGGKSNGVGEVESTGGASSTAPNGTGGRVQWSSPTEFLLTCIGFSVGLGNVWRFPYLCYKNGGGAFLIPYTLMIVTTGVPQLFMEYASGQYFGVGSLSLFKTVCPMFKGLGLCYFVLNSLVCVYYNVIIALSLYYIFSSFTAVLPWSHCNNTYNTANCGDPGNHSVFDNITMNISTLNSLASNWSVGDDNATIVKIDRDSPSEEFFRFSLMGEDLDQSIGNLGTVRWKLCLCLLLAWVLVAIFVSKGIKSSGKVSYLTTTFPYIMLTVLVIRGVTLEGALDGILYFLVPQWEKLLDPEVWFQAAIQMFYALNLAWGGMITMSSYNQLNHNCYRDAIVINLVSFGTSLYAGVAVFAIIGFMANEQKIAIQDVIKTGPGLAFVAYPRALSLMPAPQVFSVAFFFMLFLLGVGSQMVCVETIITGIMDTWQFLVRKWQYRVGVIGVVSSVLFIVGIPCTTQGGMYVLQLMDHYSAGFSVLIVAVFECFVINWVYGHTLFKQHIYEMMKYRLHPYYSFCWKYFSPFFILVITVFSFVKYKPVEYGAIPYPAWAEVVGWCMALASSLPIFIVAVYVFMRAKGSTIPEKLKNATAPKTQSNEPNASAALAMYSHSSENVEKGMDSHNLKLPLKQADKQEAETKKSKYSAVKNLNNVNGAASASKKFDRTVSISDSSRSVHI